MAMNPNQLLTYGKRASRTADVRPIRRFRRPLRRRTLPCTWFRNGECPVLRDGAMDCGKPRRIGCPYLGEDGKISPFLTRYFDANPRLLASWLLGGLYSPSGVN